MAKYHVATIERPQDWKPRGPDDVPCQIAGRYEVVCETADLFSAVRQAIELNEKAQDIPHSRWAVVIDREASGRYWPSARLCTPISYKVASIWRPEGWDPGSARDVPNCVWRAQGQSSNEIMSYRQATDTVLGLNQQSIDTDGTMWYVVLAVENEPLSHSLAFDIIGTETATTVRRLHVVPPENAGHGDCGHCPAHAFQCGQCSCDLVMPESIAEALSRSSRG